MQRIALFEDETSRQFAPLTLLRPVFELVCGHGPLRERLMRDCRDAEWGALIREELAEVYAEEHPQLAVNDPQWLSQAPTLLINGRWLADPQMVGNIDPQSVGVIDDTPVVLVLHPDEVPLLESQPIGTAISQLAATRQAVPVDGVLLQYPWNLIEHNCEQLIADFSRRVTRPTKANIDPRVAILGSDDDVFIHPTADLDPYVVIDARKGPVWIDEGAQLQAFTRVEGPCFIGRESQLFRANVKAGTTIGPVCRVGGEIEECVLHGHANKYHDGFLGHGYVCPWVNLGALTTNSDLKNDYSAVKVPLSGVSIDSGSKKVGCFIGDHAKTAIGSFLNTGPSVGAMSLVLPAGELLPKHIPPFSRIWHGNPETLSLEGLEAGIATARIAMSRRDVELTPALERLLRHAYRATANERTVAADRLAARTARTTVRN
ncbi:MAG: putative sugar nucleotidyl transferase [Planctomycetaceae bacterium]